MATRTLPTRALLACGAAAGPLYVTVSLIETFTRAGFDMRIHRFTALTTGELGWIHQAAMVLVGLAMIVLAVGVSRALGAGPGAVWTPRLVALFGVAYVVGGLLRADPVAGFPPGTPPELMHATWHGILQDASRTASTIFLFATSVVFAGRIAARGGRGWLWFVAIPAVFAALSVLGLLVGVNPVAPAFLATPWVWMTAFAVHLYRRATAEPRDVAAGHDTRAPLVAR